MSSAGRVKRYFQGGVLNNENVQAKEVLERKTKFIEKERERERERERREEGEATCVEKARDGVEEERMTETPKTNTRI